MVPSWMLTLSLLIAMLAGIALIIWAKHLRNTGPLFTLKLFGHTFTATRAMMQIAIGCILILTPVILHASTDAPSTVPERRAAKVSEVAHIAEPEYKNVVFTRDLSHLDLRSVEYSPWYMAIPGLRDAINAVSDRKIRTNPATLTNYLWLRKRAPIDRIAFKYSSSGKIDARSLTHNFDLLHALPEQHGGNVLSDSWAVVVDISRVPVGEEFLVINEVTYWNGFNRSEGDWFATYPGNQPEDEELSMLVLFPESKPFRNYELYGHAEGKQPQKFAGRSLVLPSNGNRAFYWQIDRPVAGNVYEFHWKW